MNETKEDNKEQEGGNTGIQPKGYELLTELDSRIERIKEENSRAERINQERTEIMARDKISGRSKGADNEKPKEETPAEYKDRVLRGTL